MERGKPNRTTMGFSRSGVIESMIKTHSIVTEDCLLRDNHIGKPVVHNGITGYLIRYIPTCDHYLASLSSIDAKKCLSLVEADADIPV